MWLCIASSLFLYKGPVPLSIPRISQWYVQKNICYYMSYITRKRTCIDIIICSSIYGVSHSLPPKSVDPFITIRTAPFTIF